MYKYFNNNPINNQVTGDCVIRALSVLLNQSWDKTYTDLALLGYSKGLMPSTNAVHLAYLEQYGFRMFALPSHCYDKCITVKEFSEMHPIGRYLLATGDHVVALIDGDYYDSFDSSNEYVNYYFKEGA